MNHDIDPRQSGSGLFRATTQPSLDEIKALAIRVLQGPASKTEQVLAAAFLDARRQIERTHGEDVRRQFDVVLRLRRMIETGLDDDGDRVLLSPEWPQIIAEEEWLLGKLIADEAKAKR